MKIAAVIGLACLCGSATDNASGIAALISLAKAFKALPSTKE